jgi:small multidrug resistance family-3 protein
MRPFLPFLLLVVATSLETGGDAIIRLGLMPRALALRAGLMLAGAATLYLYGLVLNLAPLDWGRLVGAYVATFFVVGQVLNLMVFRTGPSLPIVVGGLFIVAGGAIATFWRS